MNNQAFFSALKAKFGALKQGQVYGLNVLLSSTELPLTAQAYCLATAWHETATTMQPIGEYGAKSYFDKYEPTTAKGRELGNTLKGDGYKFRGRGYVQLTGRRNYAYASGVLGLDLVTNPDLAMQPSIAAKVLYTGMRDGWFTGKRLTDYIQASGKVDYLNARRVVNGVDRAELIAEYAQAFEKALNAAVDNAPRLPPDIENGPPLSQGTGLLAALVRLFMAIFGGKQ